MCEMIMYPEELVPYFDRGTSSGHFHLQNYTSYLGGLIGDMLKDT
jgi:hypothetical protein